MTRDTLRLTNVVCSVCARMGENVTSMRVNGRNSTLPTVHLVICDECTDTIVAARATSGAAPRQSEGGA